MQWLSIFYITSCFLNKMNTLVFHFLPKNITHQYVKCFQHSKVFYKLNDCLTWEKGHLVRIDICKTWYTRYLGKFAPFNLVFSGLLIFFSLICSVDSLKTKVYEENYLRFQWSESFLCIPYSTEHRRMLGWLMQGIWSCVLATGLWHLQIGSKNQTVSSQSIF